MNSHVKNEIISGSILGSGVERRELNRESGGGEPAGRAGIQYAQLANGSRCN